MTRSPSSLAQRIWFRQDCAGDSRSILPDRPAKPARRVQDVLARVSSAAARLHGLALLRAGRWHALVRRNLTEQRRENGCVADTVACLQFVYGTSAEPVLSAQATRPSGSTQAPPDLRNKAELKAALKTAKKFGVMPSLACTGCQAVDPNPCCQRREPLARGDTQ